MFQNNPKVNDKSGRDIVKWSSTRGAGERLRHRPHISHTTNSRGDKYVQYYSSLDADILFGGQFIDEVVSIAWQVQQNAMPIFGYNSYTFDDMAVGSRMVSGQFVVNFTEANYLSKVLSVMSAISRSTYGQDLGASTLFADPERKRRNLPMWDKGFDIVIGYGEKKANSPQEYKQVVMLDCCQLTGCTQQLDSNGEPLTETYSFIARDMKYTSANQYLPSSEEEQKEPITPEEHDILKTFSGSISKSTGYITITSDFIDSVVLDAENNVRLLIEDLGPIEYIMQKVDNAFKQLLSDRDLSKIIKMADENGVSKVEADFKFTYSNPQTANKSNEEISIMLNIEE